jgi:hypothetical protein
LTAPEQTPVAGQESAPRAAHSAAQPTAAPPAIVLFDHVTKTYDNGFTAIKDVSFCVDDKPNEMEILTILGPSGRVSRRSCVSSPASDPQHPGDHRLGARAGQAGGRDPALTEAWCSRTTRPSTIERSRTMSRSGSSAAGVSRAERRGACSGMDRQSGTRRGSRRVEVSAPVVRRHAPTRGDRAVADPQPQDHP